MNIAQVTPYFLPVEGGLEKHVYHISKELIKRGHKVDVLTSDIDRHGNRLPHHEVIDGINVYRFRTWFKLGDFGAFWPGFIKKLKEYDIVHVHNYRHPHTILAAIYCKLKGISCVITTHSPFHTTNRRFLAKLLVTLYDKLLSYLVDNFYDAIITVNVDEYKRFSERFSDKTFLIPSSGIEEDFLLKNSRKSRKNSKSNLIILLIGRIHPSKGILEAIKLVDVTKNSIPNVKVKLHVIGPVEDRVYFEKVKEEIRKRKLEETVKFLGSIYDPGRKFRLIDESDILLVSSPYEAAGLVIIEALARGKAVLARESPGPKTIKKICEFCNCVHLYRSMDEALLLLRDLLERQPLTTELVNCAKLFMWSVLADSIYQVYLKRFSS